jgi:hypothetical protein
MIRDGEGEAEEGGADGLALAVGGSLVNAGSARTCRDGLADVLGAASGTAALSRIGESTAAPRASTINAPPANTPIVREVRRWRPGNCTGGISEVFFVAHVTSRHGTRAVGGMQASAPK